MTVGGIDRQGPVSFLSSLATSTRRRGTCLCRQCDEARRSQRGTRTPSRVCDIDLYNHLLVVATSVRALGDVSQPRCDLLPSPEMGLWAGGLSGAGGPPPAPRTPRTATRCSQWAHGVTPCWGHASACPQMSVPRAVPVQAVVVVDAPMQRAAGVRSCHALHNKKKRKRSQWAHAAHGWPSRSRSS